MLLIFIMYFLYGSVLLLSAFEIKGSQVDRSQIDVNTIPDADKMTVDFIQKYGYPAEMHEVATEDNYILTLHRIPHNGTNSHLERPVVLLQHGIVLSSDQWVLRGPSEDLVFLLSQQGYDVWMSNTRGTQYSRHVIYSLNDYKFWNYSLDELGNYDLSAIIDYVLSTTGKPHLTYVGHSRGVAMAVILLSSQPKYNSKINLFLGIAPVIYSKEAKCPIYQLAGNRPSALMKTATLQNMIKIKTKLQDETESHGRITEIFFGYLEGKKINLEIKPVHNVLLNNSPVKTLAQIFQRAQIRNLLFTTKSMRLMLHRVCKPGAILDNVCPYISFFINGEDFQMFNKTLVPLMISHFTLGVGAKELLHLLQISESDIFRPFVYERKTNLQVYGSEEPQPYNLQNILVPTYLYYGPNDLFVSERDFFKFANQLPNFKEAYRVPYKKFNHIDYIFAKNANRLLYPHIISVINEYNKLSE